MITREHKAYILTCDNCGKTAEPAFPSRIDAANFAVVMGWVIRRKGNTFRSICPKCKEDKPHGR